MRLTFYFKGEGVAVVAGGDCRAFSSLDRARSDRTSYVSTLRASRFPGDSDYNNCFTWRFPRTVCVVSHLATSTETVFAKLPYDESRTVSVNTAAKSHVSSDEATLGGKSHERVITNFGRDVSDCRPSEGEPRRRYYVRDVISY